MARSLLFPSTEETAILRHLPKETSLNKEAVKTLYDRQLIFSPLSANHPTTIPKKWIYLKFNSKIQDGGQEPLRRIDACLEPTAAAAQCGNAWPPPSPLYHTNTGFQLLTIFNSHICSIETTMSTKNSEKKQKLPKSEKKQCKIFVQKRIDSPWTVFTKMKQSWKRLR